MPYPVHVFDDALDNALFPILGTAPIAQRLNGVFSITPDGGPLIGQAANTPGLWIAESVWVTHAGGVGKVIVEGVLGRQPSFDISAFGPHRFDGRDKADIRNAARHRYNNIYEWPSTQ